MPNVTRNIICAFCFRGHESQYFETSSNLLRVSVAASSALALDNILNHLSVDGFANCRCSRISCTFVVYIKTELSISVNRCR